MASLVKFLLSINRPYFNRLDAIRALPEFFGKTPISERPIIRSSCHVVGKRPAVQKWIKTPNQATVRFSTTAFNPEGVNGVVASPYGPVDLPDNVSLPQLILDATTKHGDRIAFVDSTTDRELTYSQLKDQVIRVASALVRSGLQKGDVVTLSSPNCIEFVVFYLAAASVGAVVSAVSPLYTPGELATAVSGSKTKLLITIPQLVPVANAALQNSPDCKIIVFGEAEGCRPFSSLLEDDGKAFPENVDINPREDLVALPYSSGTTGLPKGVMLTHHNIVSNILQQSTPFTQDLHTTDTLLGILPMFHIYGQTVTTLAGMLCGTRIVTIPKFDPQHYLGCIEKYKATLLHVAPPMILLFAKHPLVAKVDFSSVHTMIIGAAPVSPELIKETAGKTREDIMFKQGYGLTEASPVTHTNPNDMKIMKHNTAGFPMHDTEYKIIHLETGEPLGVGESGELCVRGPQVMKGYLNNEKATAETIKDGWLYTGDIGHRDEDGHLTVTDRLKELIKYKGYQVAPAELEGVLMTHPSILDAAVIGKADERAGELPRAYVVLKPNASASEDEVMDFVKGKVAPFKELKGGVEFRPEIPKSISGKILRKDLRQELLQKKD